MPENKIHVKSANFIFASLLTGVYDVNRNELLQQNDFSVIQKWYNSILRAHLKAIVFHNSFSANFVKKYSNEHIQFVEVHYDGRLKPNVYRYFIYQNYLQTNLEGIENIFVTDITDVEVLKNPFESDVFSQNSDFLFCGDEPKILDNDWMRNHSSHLRDLMPEFSKYEVVNKHETLLNCGVIGSNLTIMKSLFDKMVQVHEAFSYSNTTAYTLDMGVFNFVARTAFANKIMHGKPVNTVFKAYESERTDCWFRHK